MADIDTVLERLVNDAEFRAALADDPAAALSGYDLSEQDLQLLAGSLDDGDDDAQRGVEQRTSKSAMVGLLASLTGSGDSTEGSDRTATSGRVRSAAGTVDPSPASKYSAPINVARGDAIHTRGVDDLTGRPVGQPQAAGGGVADRLNTQPAGSVTVPLSSSGSAAPPDLDGDGADARYGYEKWRPNSAREDLAPSDESAPVEESVRRIKAEMYVEDARTAAPGSAGPADSADQHWIKYQPSNSDAAPPTGDGDITNPVTWSSTHVGRIGPTGEVCDDFLTVEDE